jgi:hypothetical protein
VSQFLSLLPKIITDTLQVASSNEVELGDDEDPEAVRAMIRHIYDLPYDQMLEDNIVDDHLPFYTSVCTDSDSTNEDLLFHIGVFTAADKYDVASLRPLVVRKFEGLMETNWEGEGFATGIQRLIGSSAGHLADNTLQTAVATFCAKHLPHLIKNEHFVKVIHEEEPFTGRLLTSFVNQGHIPDEPIMVQLRACRKPTCRNTEPSEASLQCLLSRCVVCGSHANQLVNSSISWGGVTGLVNFKKAYIL